MKYIIMAGGRYDKFKTPKQLLKVNGEVLIERTIRLLKENGITDIAISTNNPAFDYIEVEKLRHENKYVYASKEKMKSETCWLNAYYPMDDPCCYLYGDVYYSERAIKKIVNTKVEETMFFCIPDIQDGMPRGFNTKGREPLAYKVENQKVFRKAINELMEMIDKGMFKEEPVSWNLYRQINGLSLDFTGYGNGIFDEEHGDYIAIYDYSTDIDDERDIKALEELIRIGGDRMVKCEVINQDLTVSMEKGFKKIKNIERVRSNEEIIEPNHFDIGDVFETDEEYARYLCGETEKQPIVCIKILEVIPEKIEVKLEEPKIEGKKVLESLKNTKEIKPITKKAKKVK